MASSSLTRRYRILALASAWVLACGLRGLSEKVSEDHTRPDLTHIDEVRMLTPDRAYKAYRVRLHAVVTYFDTLNMFVQDATGGIWVTRAPSGLTAVPGQLLDLQGITTYHGFAPDIGEPRWRVIGRAAMPKARRVSMDELASTMVDSKWVELEGVVRSAQIGEDGRVRFTLQMLGGRVAGFMPAQAAVPPRLVDSHVRIRGVCGAFYNDHGQTVGIKIFVPDADKIRVLEAGPIDPFALASWPIGRMHQFNQPGLFRHRLKVQGVVIARFPGDDLYIADQSGSVYVATTQTSQLFPGDRVEVVGFPAVVDYRPVVQDAIYLVDGSGPSPAPVSISANQELSDKYDSTLVTAKGLLRALSVIPDGRLLTLDSSGILFSAVLRGRHLEQRFPFREGSLLQVTGILVIEKNTEGLVQSFTIRLRSLQDAVLIEGPSGWTLGRAMLVISALTAITIVILAWFVFVRRQVRAQTKDLVVNSLKLALANEKAQKALDMARNAESLEADRQRVLELVARDEPVDRVLDQLAATAAAHCPSAVYAIVVNILGGRRISSLPALPGDWQSVLRQIEIGTISVGPGFHKLRQFSQDPVWEHWLEAHLPCRFQTFISVPILVNGRMAGVIVAFFANKNPTDAQPELLGSFSKLAGLALERRSLYEQLSFSARYDLLTGLPNRPHVYQRLAEEAGLAVQNGSLLGVLYIDLDGFKKVNDIHGHAAGDKVLQEVAARMTLNVRRGDTVGRIGGDEFVIVLPHLGSSLDAERVAALIRAALLEPIHFEERTLWIDASFGISHCPLDGVDPDRLLNHADSQMYRAKRAHQVSR
jgi:diguanylate cyclase (GGDEF)-like protein